MKKKAIKKSILICGISIIGALLVALIVILSVTISRQVITKNVFNNEVRKILEVEKVSEKTAEINPQIVDSERGIVADIVLGEGAYPIIDNDISDVLQLAIDELFNIGGGTVFIPKGEYFLRKGIYVRAMVAVVGVKTEISDERDNYGTVIIADSLDYKGSLFDLTSGSCGVDGLTVYYAKQSLDNVIPYDFTFIINDGMLSTVKNVNIINPYRGIGACVYSKKDVSHEMLTVENVKMSPLDVGIAAYNQSDVGIVKDVAISNEYWLNSAYDKPSESELNNYTKENTFGMVMGDMEWTEYLNVNVEGYKYGVYIDIGKRVQFAGAFYNLSVKACTYGLFAVHMDSRWGTVISESYIEGDVYSVYNSSSGGINLFNTELVGETKNESYLFNTTSFIKTTEKPDLNIYREKTLTSTVNTTEFVDAVKSYDVDNSGKTDCSEDIQRALNGVSEKGGTVYLRAGYYRLDKPITIPTGVTLKGAATLANRENRGDGIGTLFLVYFGRNAENDALFTLNSGSNIYGVRFVYPENNPDCGLSPYAWCIRATGSGITVENCGFSGVWNGIELINATDFTIKRVVGAVYNDNFKLINSQNGQIKDCLTNGNAVCRLKLPFDEFKNWISEKNLFKKIMNPVTRKSLRFIVSENSEFDVVNSFVYGANKFIEAVNSDVKMINVGADNLGDASAFIDATDSKILAVNMMRYNGKSYESTNSTVNLYNRISINELEENECGNLRLSETETTLNYSTLPAE